MASLLLLTGTKKGLRLPLHEDRIAFGRDSSCQIVINDSMVRSRAAGKTDSVSRRHAVLSCIDGKYFIEDGDGRGNRSRNGTYVNEQPVLFPERTPLRSSDTIRICDFSCTFFEDTDTPISVEVSIDHESSITSLQAQTAEKLKAILEISNSLSNTLEMDDLLPRIVDNLFQLFKQADRGFILLLDEATGQLGVRVFKVRRPSNEIDARYSTSTVRQCLQTMQAILGNDVNQPFSDNQSANTLPIRSLMCTPLWSQDRKPLGAIQLDTQGPRKTFTQDDLNLLLGVASQASIALCNARFYRDSLNHQRIERDLEVANEVQRALLPQHLPDIPGYEFYAFYESAQEIGGDYYDFIPLPEQRLAILLGDVAGKGVAGALIMAKFSVEVRVCLLAEAELAAAVRKLNAVMIRAALLDRFVTLVAIVLDPATHIATLVNAGHPSPLVFRRATGDIEEAVPKEVAGPPIGVHAGYDYACCQVELLPGDGLLLFSDGVTEAMDAQAHQFRTAGVHVVLDEGNNSPRVTGERLIQAVTRHASGCPQNDDITLVCFGRNPA